MPDQIPFDIDSPSSKLENTRFAPMLKTRDATLLQENSPLLFCPAQFALAAQSCL